VRDTDLGLKMSLFFGAQVFLLPIEGLLFWQLMNGIPVYHRIPWGMSAHSSPVIDMVLETLVISSLGCAYYYGLLSPDANYANGLCFCIPALGAVFYHQFAILSKCKDDDDVKHEFGLNHRIAFQALKGVIGWCWTVTVLFIVLPYFSLPMIKCVDTTMGSVITGPLLRIAKEWL
jgi:hypothetical protein